MVTGRESAGWPRWGLYVTFDLDGADAAMRAIEGYVFPESCRDKIENLSAYVADVAMEEVILLTDELMEALQK